jgi:hypothetical protein
MPLHASGGIVRQAVLLAGAFGVAFAAAWFLDRVRPAPPPREVATSPTAAAEGMRMPHPSPAGQPPMMSPEILAMQLAQGRMSGPGMLVPPGWKTQRLEVGSQAPDFALLSLTRDGVVTLSSLRDKSPVVLVFGNFGCDQFCKHLSGLNKLHRDYKNRAAFLFVYCDEGLHKEVLPWLPGEDAVARIRRGWKQFGLAMPCLLADRAVQDAYMPLPSRLLAIERTGHIALDGFVVDPRKMTPPSWDLEPFEAWLQQTPELPSSADPGVSGT